MSVMDLSPAIDELLENVTYSTVSQTEVDGEIIETISTTETLQLACMPITFKDLRYLPEGVYSLQDYKFYRTGDSLLELNSIVTFSGTQYKIGAVSDRRYHGNFSISYGKKMN